MSPPGSDSPPRHRAPRSPWLRVADSHPDADRALLHHVATALVEDGAEVIVRPGEDNLIRSRRPEDGPGPAHIVVVEGLPNLMHEFTHAVLYGGLADDHGIDYGQIPFDPARAQPRRWLWEELACCVVSCAYYSASESEPASESRSAQAWFAEQVGIQGVFFGVSGGTGAFVEFVDGVRAEHPGELDPVVTAAYDGVERRLLRAGAPPAHARPRSRIPFSDLWRGLSAGRPRL